MKNGFMKKGIALGLVATTAVSLCACGSDKKANSDADKKYFRAEYIDNLPAEFNGNVGATAFKGNTLYYNAYDENYRSTGLKSYNLVSGEQGTIWKIEPASEEENVSSTDISYFTVDDDGNIYMVVSYGIMTPSGEDYSNATLDDVINFLVENWGEDENTAAEDWENYYASEYVDDAGNPDYEKFLTEMNSEYTSITEFAKVKADGTVIFKQQLENGEGVYINCYSVATDKKGNFYACMNEWNESGSEDIYYVLVWDSEGNEKGKIEFDDYTTSVVEIPEGKVAAVGWGNEGMEMKVLDADKMAIGDTIAVESDQLRPYDEKNMMVSENGVLYKFNLETKEKEELLSWMDCNISSSSVMNYGLLSDGNIAVFTQTWNNMSGEQRGEIAIIKEISAEEAGQVTEIDVACMWLDSTVEEKAIEFNKTHDEYHINIRTYEGDDDTTWEDMLNAFTTDVASNPDIDIVIFNDYSQVVNFSAKGLLCDMYELMDNDQALTREDFLSNILTACEYEGKLVALPTGFTLSTVIGKVSDVGTTPGWTVADMKALLESKPEGTKLFQNMTRTDMLNTCLSLNYDSFINWEDATCNFDSQEFVDVLEFANMMPEDYEYDEDVSFTEQLNSGKVLLDTYNLGDFNEIQMYTVIFGEELTYIGYPTSEGNGALLNLQNIYGITNNCEEKDAAWQFVREFYLPIESSDNENGYSSMGYYGFSVRQDDFDRYCEDAMKENENNSGTWGWDNFEVEIQPATQEQVDAVRDLVANTTSVNGAVSQDVMNIIIEESEAYFSGQKSAEDVAKTLQSRMGIYLSETK